MKKSSKDLKGERKGYGITVKIFSQDPEYPETSKSLTIYGYDINSIYEQISSFFKILEGSNEIEIIRR